MATNGSRRWFQYTGDDGNTYAVELDENVYETVALGFTAIQAGPTGPQAQGRVISANNSRPLTMRTVRGQFVKANNDIVYKSFFVGTQAALNSLIAAGVLVLGGTQNWSLTGSQGEVRVLIPATDTAQLDGDIDDNFVAGP
ncbi:MAG: hypothetical protein AAFX78_19840 [Cyanobacteria bacterium J06638_20]